MIDDLREQWSKRRGQLRRTILDVAALTAAIFLLNEYAFASEPDYDESYASRFKAITGYPPTEEGVRRALDNFYALDREESLAAIAVVGEMQYLSLVPRIKELYAVVPPFEVGFSVETRKVPPSRIVLSGRYRQWNALIARALLRCGDEEVIPVVADQAKHCRELENGTVGLLIIRNVKYLAMLADANVVEPLLTIIGDPPRVDWATYQAVRELREVEYFLRFTMDPRFQTFRHRTDQVLEALDREYARAIERATDEEERIYFDFSRAQLGEFRKVQPTWMNTTRSEALKDMKWWHEFPLVVEIIDYVLLPPDSGQR